ncbi:MAG: Asp23/Gls24 family envelope stress response protein [Anaerolineae bacterium]|nr:Asp23/Gls24 family envelope stress response protein [Anaerolineae bacterium]
MLNTVTISPDIVRDVARITVLATPGVISLVEAGGGWLKRVSSGIETNLSEGEHGPTAQLKLHVIGHTGHSLQALATQIRHNLAQAIHEVTGVTVSQVDITFEDVRAN